MKEFREEAPFPGRARLRAFCCQLRNKVGARSVGVTHRRDYLYHEFTVLLISACCESLCAIYIIYIYRRVT